MSDKLSVVLENIKKKQLEQNYGPSGNTEKQSKKNKRQPQQGFYRAVRG